MKAPVNGWANGRYALLSTPTSGLALTLEGTEGAVVAETANGLTTYYATVAIAGEVDVVCTGETLTAGDKNQIRRNVEQLFAGKTDAASLALKTRYGQAKKLVVSGPVGSVAVMRTVDDCDHNGNGKLDEADYQALRTKFKELGVLTATGGK